MPNFGSSQKPSGPNGAPAGRRGGQGSQCRYVGADGIANGVNTPDCYARNGVSIAREPIGNRSGPSYSVSFEPEFDSSRQMFRGNFSIAGQTLDSAGSPLGGCRVELNESRSDVEYGEVTSDGSGNYSFTIPWNSWNWQVVAYKVGSPDVAGITVDTLIATWNGN